MEDIPKVPVMGKCPVNASPSRLSSFLGSAACHKKVKKRKENVEFFFPLIIFLPLGALRFIKRSNYATKRHTRDRTMEETLTMMNANESIL